MESNWFNEKYHSLIHLSKLRFIGYSVGIYPNKIVARVPKYANLSKFMRNNTPYNHTSLNTFVLVESDNYFFIGIINKEDMSEHDTRDLINDAYNDKTESPEINISILSEINPINRHLIKSNQHFPVMHSRVYLADDGLVESFIQEISSDVGKEDSKNSSQSLNCTSNFAELLQDKNVSVNLSFDDLFSKHLGIIGSTGSGKSYTAAKLILELVKKGQHVILLDPTGEYRDLIKHVKDHHGLVKRFYIGHDTKIPYSELNVNELYKLINPSPGIQMPKLKAAIDDLKFANLYHNRGPIHLLKKNFNNSFISKDVEKDNNRDTNYFVKVINNGYNAKRINNLKSKIYSELQSFHGTLGYNFSELPRQLREECHKINPKSVKLNNQTWKFCASLADRINSFVRKGILSKYFCNNLLDDKERSNFAKSLTYHEISKYNITYINLEHVTLSDSIAEVIGNYIARKLLNSFINYNNKINNDSKNSQKQVPAVLFLDEAHNFIKEDNEDDDYHLDSFDLIAKEGRKYGLFLTLITQSPLDLDRDVLTQFGTFIIHHLSNKFERDQITGILPYNSGLDLFIPSLTTGEAIISSNNLYIPLMVKIVKPTVAPKSNTPKFE